MKGFGNIAKRRIINAKAESLLIIVSVAFSASVLFSVFSLGAGFLQYFFVNAERLTGNSLTQVQTNAKTNVLEIGNYFYELYRFFKTGYVEPKDCVKTDEYGETGEYKLVDQPVPLADNAENLFSADSSVENLPLMIIVISAAALLCVCFSLSLAFAVSNRERRSFYATMLASGATQKQVRKCFFYESFYYCAVSIPSGLLLSVLELSAVKFAADKIFDSKFSAYGVTFDVNIGLSPGVIAVAGVLIFLLVWRFSLKAGKKLSVRAVATDAKKTFVTSIGDRVLTESAKTYNLLGIEYYIAFRNFHNNLGKYICMVFMTVTYSTLVGLSLMMFTAMHNFIRSDVNVAVSELSAFSYAAEIYACSAGAMIALITVIATFNAIHANINSNVSEYALMRSVGSTVKSVLRTVRIEGHICNCISFVLSLICAVLVFIFTAQAYQRDARVDFGSPYLFWGVFAVSMTLLVISVTVICYIMSRRMKRIDLIGALKDFVY